MSNTVFKTKDRKPDFPCYLWHAELNCWIFASSQSAFTEGWEEMYSHWHVMQRDFPQDPPEQ